MTISSATQAGAPATMARHLRRYVFNSSEVMLLSIGSRASMLTGVFTTRTRAAPLSWHPRGGTQVSHCLSCFRRASLASILRARARQGNAGFKKVYDRRIRLPTTKPRSPVRKMPIRAMQPDRTLEKALAGSSSAKCALVNASRM